MIQEAVYHLRNACQTAGIPALRIFSVESATRTKLVPQALVLLDAQRTRMEVDGSLISTRIDLGPPKVRVYRRRSHKVTVVVVVEIVDDSAAVATVRAQAVVAAMGRGFYDFKDMWVAVKRAQLEFREARAQTAQGRTTAIVLFEFQGGFWEDKTAPLITDVQPDGSVE